MIAPVLQTDPVFQAVALALIEAGAVLRSSDDAAAQLWFDAGHLAFVFHGPSFQGDAFGARVRRLCEQIASANLDLVIVGGPRALYESAVDARPRSAGQRRVGVAYVTVDGALEIDGTARLVNHCLQAAFGAGVPPLKSVGAVDAVVAESMRRGHAQAEELSAFQQRLGAGRPLVTYGLVAVMVALYLAQRSFGGETLTAVSMGAVAPGRAWSEPWRLLAYAFLHVDPQHIAFNAISLVSLGAFYERLLGPGRMLSVFALAALGGGVASAIGAPQVVMIGASGAIWGMLGVSAALALRPGKTLPEAFQRPFRQNTLANLVIQAMVSMLPHVSFLAHLGGGLAGFALMLSGAVRPREGEATEGPVARAFGALSGVVLGVSVVLALLVGKPWTLRDPLAVQPYHLGTSPWTLALPSPPHLESRTPVEEYTVGDTRNDGYVIDIRLAREVIAPDEFESAAAAMREQLSRASAPRGTTAEGAITRTTVRGVPVLAQRFRGANDTVLERRVMVRPAGYIAVDLYRRSDDVRVAGLLDRVLASVHE